METAVPGSFEITLPKEQIDLIKSAIDTVARVHDMFKKTVWIDTREAAERFKVGQEIRRPIFR